MSVTLDFRAAEPTDAEEITGLALRSKAHWGYSREFMDACRDELTYTSKQIEDTARHFVVALNEDSLTGFYALEDQCEDQIELGARWLEIAADPHALAFYQAAGAIQSGECASASIPGRMLPLLWLDLAKYAREAD